MHLNYYIKLLFTKFSIFVNNYLVLTLYISKYTLLNLFSAILNNIVTTINKNSILSIKFNLYLLIKF